MKNFLTTSFVALALILGATGAAPVAHAESLGGVPQEGQACDIVPKSGKADGIMQNGSCITLASYTSKSQTAAANTPLDSSKSGSEDAAYNGIMIKIMTLFAWLAGVAMITLNYAVFYTVVSMGDLIHNLTAIGVTWRILRDIGNIALIFGFLAIGISIILNTERIGYGKKMLPMLLIAAVFLNFSLFMTEAVIDVGNLFATQFYTQISGGTLPTKDTLGNEGISDKIMSQLGLQTIYGDVNKPDRAKEIFKSGNPWIIGFMSILLFIVLAFVLFSLAFILIARLVILIFLIILAPVGFAGLAVPQLAGKAKQWWDTLFAQTITAPILLLLLYIALSVITDVQFLTGFGSNQGADWLGTVTGNLAGFAPVFLSFLVAMGLLLAVTISAKSLSAFGASKATALAGKLTFGATAWGMRSTVGWGSTRAATGWRKMGLSRAPVIGRAVSGVLDRGSKASFDARGISAGGGLKGIGIDAGAAQKGGYRDWEKGKIKEREDYAKTLEQTTGKFLGVSSIGGVRVVPKGEVEKQKEAEEAKIKAEQKIKETESHNARTMQVLGGKHKVEMEQYNDEVEKAQKNLAKLEDDHRKGGNVSPKELTATREALTAARTSREQRVTEQGVEKEELKKTNDQLIEVQQTEVKERQKTIDALKNAGKEGYSRGLEMYSKDKEGKDKEGLLWGTVRLVNPQRNTKAAENIRKEAKKSKSDKDLEYIKKIIEEKDKPKTEEKKEEKKPEAAH